MVPAGPGIPHLGHLVFWDSAPSRSRCVSQLTIAQALSIFQADTGSWGIQALRFVKQPHDLACTPVWCGQPAPGLQPFFIGGWSHPLHARGEKLGEGLVAARVGVPEPRGHLAAPSPGQLFPYSRELVQRRNLQGLRSPVFPTRVMRPVPSEYCRSLSAKSAAFGFPISS